MLGKKAKHIAKISIVNQRILAHSHGLSDDKNPAGAHDKMPRQQKRSAQVRKQATNLFISAILIFFQIFSKAIIRSKRLEKVAKTLTCALHRQEFTVMGPVSGRHWYHGRLSVFRFRFFRFFRPRSPVLPGRVCRAEPELTVGPDNAL